MSDSNKDTAAPPSVVSTLALTFRHDTFQLDVKGEAPTLEVFMSMLDQAKRYFEQQLRAQAAVALRQQLAQQQRTEQLIHKVAHG